jgi:hypothetical protein
VTDATDAGGLSHDRERDAAHWVARAEAEVPRLLSGGRPAALDRFERDEDAYRRALSRFIATGDADRAARLVQALRCCWTERGRVRLGVRA